MKKISMILAAMFFAVSANAAEPAKAEVKTAPAAVEATTPAVVETKPVAKKAPKKAAVEAPAKSN